MLVNKYEDISLLSKNELYDLVVQASDWDTLLNQILSIKCAIRKSPKKLDSIKKIIDKALNYERPNNDPYWGHYDSYLHEIKKSILSLKSEISNSEIREMLVYLKFQAENDHIFGEFEEDGEWSMVLDDINEFIHEFEN